LGDLIEKARIYAIGAHARINQLRKYTRQPYDVHLKAVAELVASVSDDEALIAAAWLHDTVEDTPATFEDLEREFGADVMQLVSELTDVSRPGGTAYDSSWKRLQHGTSWSPCRPSMLQRSEIFPGGNGHGRTCRSPVRGKTG
jgi:(p)ppGpp synthase/HD superfamily hydrolase